MSTSAKLKAKVKTKDRVYHNALRQPFLKLKASEVNAFVEENVTSLDDVKSLLKKIIKAEIALAHAIRNQKSN